jgi:hypothetical protein
MRVTVRIVAYAGSKPLPAPSEVKVYDWRLITEAVDGSGPPVTASAVSRAYSIPDASSGTSAGSLNCAAEMTSMAASPPSWCTMAASARSCPACAAASVA